jgi:DNA-binding MurR/RpiR family transcriptional regulator
MGSQLSPQQRVIADYLMENISEVPFLSVFDLAERTQTSEATVVRLCQRLGYSGYSDMKVALVETIRSELPASQAPNETQDIGVDALAAMARLEQYNIRRTVELIDRRTFGEVARQLHKADHIFTFGLGISAYLADFASYLFTEHGMRATRLATHFTSPREQLVLLRPSDTVLTFSFSPYSEQTFEVLKEARSRGVPTIVITDRATSPGVSMADMALVVSSHGMTFTNATASIDVLLNALVLEIASHNKTEAVETFARINSLVSNPVD